VVRAARGEAPEGAKAVDVAKAWVEVAVVEVLVEDKTKTGDHPQQAPTTKSRGYASSRIN